MTFSGTPNRSVIFPLPSDGPFQSGAQGTPQLFGNSMGPEPVVLIVQHSCDGHQPDLTRPAPTQDVPMAGMTDSIARQPPHLSSFLGRDNGQQTVQIIVFVHMHSLRGDKAEAKHPKSAIQATIWQEDTATDRLSHTRFLPSCKHLRHSKEYQDV